MIRCKDLGLIKIKRRHKKYENEKKVDTWLVVERVDRSGQDVGQLLWPAWEILSPTPPMMIVSMMIIIMIMVMTIIMMLMMMMTMIMIMTKMIKTMIMIMMMTIVMIMMKLAIMMMQMTMNKIIMMTIMNWTLNLAELRFFIFPQKRQEPGRIE